MKDYLISRLREASTWRALILIATALGMNINPELQQAILTIGLLMVGGVGAAMPDTTKAGEAVKAAKAMDTLASNNPPTLPAGTTNPTENKP